MAREPTMSDTSSESVKSREISVQKKKAVVPSTSPKQRMICQPANAACFTPTML